TLRRQDTHTWGQSAFEPDLGSAFDPTRTVARAGTKDSTPGVLLRWRRRELGYGYGDEALGRIEPELRRGARSVSTASTGAVSLVGVIAMPRTR
ncbi:MAG: hypothetical protein ACLP01_16910, partial [Solirubrobacteraceae bacterium]